MKLAVACKICKELGSTTIGEAILFVRTHASSLFPYEEIDRELEELDAEAVGVDRSTSLEVFLSSGYRMIDTQKGSHFPFLYRGICEDTGEEVIGYAVKCDGRVNPGQVFICPVVSSASFAGIGEKGEPLHSFGPFYLIVPETLELALGPNAPAAQSQEEQKNTLFEFLYRDASNYKTYNRILLSGTLAPEEVAEIYACSDGGFFIAEQVGLFHSFPGTKITEDDHAWCTLYEDGDHGFSTTYAAPAKGNSAVWLQEKNRFLTAKELLENFRAAKGHWNVAKYLPELIYSSMEVQNG